MITASLFLSHIDHFIVFLSRRKFQRNSQCDINSLTVHVRLQTFSIDGSKNVEGTWIELLFDQKQKPGSPLFSLPPSLPPFLSFSKGQKLSILCAIELCISQALSGEPQLHFKTINYKYILDI